MRAFVRCSVLLVAFAAIPSGRVLAQSAEEPEEVIVRAKPLTRYRTEIEVARNEMITLFNEVNEGDENDVRCRYETPNQQFRDAVVKYRELEDEFDSARGKTIRIPMPSFALKGPQCEASTYTEYVQLNDVARITGTVKISACPAGATGKFTLVARVRDDAGTSTPIEFSEMWVSDDSQDYIFFGDYPIGHHIFLESVRVHNLTCTCEPTQ